MGILRAAALAALLAGATALAPGASRADDIKIGAATLTSSVDPHYHDVGPNNAARLHVFEGLVRRTAETTFAPSLATAWKAIDDRTWEFTLRQGVRFHDGTPFTAEDVIATFARVPKVPNSPASYEPYINYIERLEAPDPHRLIVRTREPFPTIVAYIGAVGILPKAVAETARKEDFDTGRSAIGTGPYRVAEFVPGNRLVLLRNDAYWGEREPWEKVTFQLMSNSATRVAALLAGDVDLVDKPSIADLDALRRNQKLTVVEGPTYFLLYLSMDQHLEPPPGVTGTNGRNPFKDRRVREAVAKAIDREAIVRQIMEGNARVASQLVIPGFVGHDPAIQAPKADPARARELLREAGYPDGFELVLTASNNRYINDAKIALALAQMLTRAGIKTTVESVPVAVLFSRRNKFELGFYMAGWGTNTGEAIFPLRGLLATRNEQRTMGTHNYARYSNPRLDDLLARAMVTIDDAARAALLRDAMRTAMDDHAILVLHEEMVPWAMRKGLTYRARQDQDTLAMDIRPSP